MSTSVGQRDRQVTIQQVTETRGASKAPVESWADLATVPMSKEDRGSRERLAAGQTTAALDSVFTLYYRADMDPERVDVAKRRRLVFQGRVYGITFGRLLDGGRDIELVTLAAGGVA